MLYKHQSVVYVVGVAYIATVLSCPEKTTPFAYRACDQRTAWLPAAQLEMS